MTPTTPGGLLPAPPGFTAFTDVAVQLRSRWLPGSGAPTLEKAWSAFALSCAPTLATEMLAVFHHDITDHRPNVAEPGPVETLVCWHTPFTFDDLLHTAGQAGSLIGEVAMWAGPGVAAAGWLTDEGWRFAQLRAVPAAGLDAIEMCQYYNGDAYSAGVLKLAPPLVALLSGLARCEEPGVAADVITAVLDQDQPVPWVRDLPAQQLNLAGELLATWQGTLPALLTAALDALGASTLTAREQRSWRRLSDVLAAASSAGRT